MDPKVESKGRVGMSTEGPYIRDGPNVGRITTPDDMCETEKESLDLRRKSGGRC